MVKFLKLEFKRIIHSKRFWIVLMIGCVISVLQYMQKGFPHIQFNYSDTIIKNWKIDGELGVHHYPLPWYEYWLGGELYTLFSYTFFMLFPILAVAPLGDSVVTDKLSGYSRNLFIRGKKSDYYKSRFVAAFLCGGFVIIVPLLLSMLMYAATCPSILSQASTGTASPWMRSMWVELYYSYTLAYSLLYLLIDFVYGGLFACFSVAVGIVSKNRFLPLVFPFVLYLFCYTVFSAVDLWEYVPFFFLTHSQMVYDINLYIIAGEALILLLAAVFIFIWGAKTDETL